jgi:hypothetical protein
VVPPPSEAWLSEQATSYYAAPAPYGSMPMPIPMPSAADPATRSLEESPDESLPQSPELSVSIEYLKLTVSPTAVARTPRTNHYDPPTWPV